MSGIYSERLEMKLVRKRYEVRIRIGYLAKDYREAFARMPDDAKLIDEDSDEAGTCLVFERETPLEEKP